MDSSATMRMAAPQSGHETWPHPAMRWSASRQQPHEKHSLRSPSIAIILSSTNVPEKRISLKQPTSISNLLYVPWRQIPPILSNRYSARNCIWRHPLQRCIRCPFPRQPNLATYDLYGYPRPGSDENPDNFVDSCCRQYSSEHTTRGVHLKRMESTGGLQFVK